MKNAYDRNKREIVEKASELAEQMKGKCLDENKMRQDFDKMWSAWIEEWDVQEKYEDVTEALESILYETFERVKEQIDSEKETFHGEKWDKELHCLVESFDFVDLKPYIIAKHRWSLNPLKHFNKKEKREIKLQRNSQTVYLINNIFREIDIKLATISRSDWKFNATEVKEMTKCIIERIDRHNQGEANDFTVSENCKIKLHIAVFDHCLPLFKNLNERYIEKHGMKAKLMKQKEIVWGHFSDTVQQKASDIVARNRLCDIIRKYVEEYVRQQIPDLIYTRTIEDFSMSKHELCIAILTDLAEKEEFDLYNDYIRDASGYALNWIKNHINRKCFEKPNSQYYELAKMKTDLIVNQVSQIASANRNKTLAEWLSEFHNEIKNDLPISPGSLSLVREQNVSDMEDFKKKLVQDLEKLSKEIYEKFAGDTADSIAWEGITPYKKVMDKLWGCECVCPFCKEPCRWNAIHTGTHSCIQHRPTGLAGWHKINSEIIVIESCSFKIQSVQTFRCGSGGTLCKRDSNKCSISETTEDSHPFRDYKKYTEDWDIHPCPDISSSRYWAWVMCRFNGDIADHYKIKKADIPSTWESYTKDDAIKSLRET